MNLNSQAISSFQTGDYVPKSGIIMNQTNTRLSKFLNKEARTKEEKKGSEPEGACSSRWRRQWVWRPRIRRPSRQFWKHKASPKFLFRRRKRWCCREFEVWKWSAEKKRKKKMNRAEESPQYRWVAPPFLALLQDEFRFFFFFTSLFKTFTIFIICLLFFFTANLVQV